VKRPLLGVILAALVVGSTAAAAEEPSANRDASVSSPTAIRFPEPPALAPLQMPAPPPSFCSETARGEYLAQVFNPTVEVSNANVAKANAHLDDLSRAIGGAATTADILAGHKAFDDYRPTADKAYRFGLDVLALRPVIMSAPVAPCAAPRQVAAAAQPAEEVHGMARLTPAADTGYVASPPSPGPRRTVAVGDVQASGGFERSEDWNAGGALSSMLAKALLEGGRVQMVERNQLGSVLNEAQMRATRVSGGDPSGPQIRMIPAQFLVVGSVTEFGAPQHGGGFSIGGVGGDGFGGALGVQRQTGKISIDLRILDTRTGEVLKAFTVTKSVSRTGVGITTDYRGLSVGSDAFGKTPLGEASRQAMQEAADRIADFVSAVPWEAKVVEADGDEVFINAGAEGGLAPGARLRLEHIGHAMTDPDTGQVLSEQRRVLGELVVEGADAKVAHGRFTPAEPGDQPQRGDLAILVSGSGE